MQSLQQQRRLTLCVMLLMIYEKTTHVASHSLSWFWQVASGTGRLEVGQLCHPVVVHDEVGEEHMTGREREREREREHSGRQCQRSLPNGGQIISRGVGSLAHMDIGTALCHLK